MSLRRAFAKSPANPFAQRRSSASYPRFLRWLADQNGSSLAEFAFVLPVAMTILTFLLSMGAYINNSLELTNATSLSGQYLAASRSTTPAADPCNLVYTSFTQVSPSLVASGLTFKLVIGPTIATGTTYTGTTCSAAAAAMLPNANAQLTVKYPCSLLSFVGDYLPSCALTSQITEIIQ